MASVEDFDPEIFRVEPRPGGGNMPIVNRSQNKRREVGDGERKVQARNLCGGKRKATNGFAARILFGSSSHVAHRGRPPLALPGLSVPSLVCHCRLFLPPVPAPGVERPGYLLRQTKEAKNGGDAMASARERGGDHKQMGNHRARINAHSLILTFPQSVSPGFSGWRPRRGL